MENPLPNLRTRYFSRGRVFDSTAECERPRFCFLNNLTYKITVMFVWHKRISYVLARLRWTESPLRCCAQGRPNWLDRRGLGANRPRSFWMQEVSLWFGYRQRSARSITWQNEKTKVVKNCHLKREKEIDIHLVDMRDKSEVVNHKTVQSQSDFLQFTFANAFDDGFSIHSREKRHWARLLSFNVVFHSIFTKRTLSCRRPRSMRPCRQ